MSQKYQYDINSCNAWKEVFEMALSKDVDIFDFTNQFLSSSFTTGNWTEQNHKELYLRMIFEAKDGEISLKKTTFNQGDWLKEMGFLYKMVIDTTKQSPKEILHKLPPLEMMKHAKNLEEFAYETVLRGILSELD